MRIFASGVCVGGTKIHGHETKIILALQCVDSQIAATVSSYIIPVNVPPYVIVLSLVVLIARIQSAAHVDEFERTVRELVVEYDVRAVATPRSEMPVEGHVVHPHTCILLARLSFARYSVGSIEIICASVIALGIQKEVHTEFVVEKPVAD